MEEVSKMIFDLNGYMLRGQLCASFLKWWSTITAKNLLLKERFFSCVQ